VLTFLWLSTGSGILRLGTRMARSPTRSGSSTTSRSESPSPADDWVELALEPLRRWNQRRKPSTIVSPPPILLALRARRLLARPPLLFFLSLALCHSVSSRCWSSLVDRFADELELVPPESLAPRGNGRVEWVDAERNEERKAMDFDGGGESFYQSGLDPSIVLFFYIKKHPPLLLSLQIMC
jgi:hypothetical protein